MEDKLIKVGMKVRIAGVFIRPYNSPTISIDMEKYRNKVTTVTGRTERDRILLSIDDGEFLWASRWLEPVSTCKLNRDFNKKEG